MPYFRVNKLMHVGVKGMHWGVRKLEEEHGVLVRKKGDELHSVSTRSNLDLSKMGGRALYTSFTPKDVLAYRANFSDQLRVMNNLDKVFEYKFSATTDLVSPDAKRRVDEFVKLHKNDTNILSEMGKSKIKAGGILMMAKYFGTDKAAAKNTEEYRKLLNSKDPKDKEKVFRDFSKFLPLSDYSRKKYFDELESKGFNSIYDDNDIFAKYSDSPLIVFNPAKTLKITEKTTLGDKEIDTAFDQYQKLTK